ncbi:LysR substrate-binding domain-containing protein [Pseudactinotalea sp. HY158]|uniref:LysR family transcriptional regulator n=1 Tax=Pseudactinotalea sp. HY158 TaxID=2654547 RepID=UPI00129CBAD8|nr:LysR substrate-binding domain-containing protein [Pseudactinotalea sp. HY158]QGH70555.1 LysR family transcriptional regulator [Pseudactinotalea sp. HY158]
MSTRGGDRGIELRQLRYFVTLAEELHFARAAAREHIVQSALSQQIQRLERLLGVVLVERTTHHVRLTPSGAVFLSQARSVLRAVDRAVAATRSASADAEVVRVAIGDASLDSMPQILRHAQYNRPGLVVHRTEATVPAQYRMLAEGSIDVGVGNAADAPRGIASEVFRLDPMGVLVAQTHPLARAAAVSVADLDGLELVLAEDAEAPEFNEFVTSMCAAAGLRPVRFPGTAQSIRAAAYLVGERECGAIVPASCDLLMPGLRWRPLEPPSLFPWSLLWRADDATPAVRAIRRAAAALSAKLDWLGDDAGGPGIAHQSHR